MLIVGTKGRSLGGFQGLVSNRNSFSKWCLQYSPIPVVVVRSTEQRVKKKLKRGADPTRQDYIKLLRASGIEDHETTHAGSLHHKPQTSHDQHTEAIAVAQALGLPPQYKPPEADMDNGLKPLRQVESAKSESTSGYGSRPVTPDHSAAQTATLNVVSPRTDDMDTPGNSGDEDSEEEGEFEAVPGHILLERQRMHDMEVGEGVHLRHQSIGSIDSNSNSNGSGSIADIDEEVEREVEATTKAEKESPLDR